MTDDIVTRLREKYLGQLPICTEAADEIERLRDEVVKYKNMAEEFGSHLNRALNDEVWDTREYAVVSCKKWLDEFYGGQPIKLPSSHEAVETVVRFLSLGNADPLKVYPPGRYQGD